MTNGKSAFKTLISHSPPRQGPGRGGRSPPAPQAPTWGCSGAAGRDPRGLPPAFAASPWCGNWPAGTVPRQPSDTPSFRKLLQGSASVHKLRLGQQHGWGLAVPPSQGPRAELSTGLPGPPETLPSAPSTCSGVISMWVTGRIMTVAMMDSSASLKLSMRWECWIPSAAPSSPEPVEQSPCLSRAGSGVCGPDMVGPGGGEALGDGSHTGFWVQCCQK